MTLKPACSHLSLDDSILASYCNKSVSFVCLTACLSVCCIHFTCWLLLLLCYFVLDHQPFNGPFSGNTQVSRYQKGKTNLDFTEARDSEWQWHQLGHMQVCTSLQTDNHASTRPLSFLQAGCPSCHPTNSFEALKAIMMLVLVYSDVI